MILLDILVTLVLVPATIQQSIQVWLTPWLASQGLPIDFSVSLLLGDGSTRSFYRVVTSQKNYILISDPQWVQTQDYSPHQLFLKDRGLPVPQFFITDPEQGFLLMEDLGDELLQNRIIQNRDQKIVWFKRAAELLAHLHGKTFPVPTTLPVAGRFFDRDKYFSELNFTLEYLHQKLLNQGGLESSALEILKKFCQDISEISPVVFAHRDYHCRNLLIRDETLFMIDFQDARLGSPHYDLASLLYDAYAPLTDIERLDVLDSYTKALKNFPVSQQIDWNLFEMQIKQVAFQRTLKAAGSFASFFIRFGKSTHFPYLIPALTSALNLQREGLGVGPSVLNIEKWITLISRIQIK